MAEPSIKHPDIDEIITETFGIDRIKSIRSDKCATCGKDTKEFRNEISRREYTISGMCQECQDSVFGVD